MQRYDLIDANNSPHLPQAPARLHQVRTLVVLWLLVLAVGIVLVPLLVITGWLRADRAEFEEEYATLQLLIADSALPSAETLHLQAELTRTTGLIDAIHAVAVPASLAWPQVVDALTQFNLAGVTLTSVQQQGSQIRMVGRAPGNDAVVRYQQSLLDSGAFREVIIASLTRLPPSSTPTPDPAARAVPATLAPVVEGSVEFTIDLVVRPLPSATFQEVSSP